MAEELNKLFGKRDFSRVMEIARQRQEDVGDPTLSPAPRKCACCKAHKAFQEFPKLPPTELTKGATDAVCATCSEAYKKELAQACRLLCGGCNEVVDVFEPYAAKAGFRFEGGKSYHVANCPICTSPPPEKSPILEMILFYRQRGIPYE